MPHGALNRRGPDAPPSRHPLVELLAIAAPSVATMTSYTAMQFVDAKMVSLIGPEPVYVAAQGNGGMTVFVPIAVVMGALGVINTYVSQNLGAGTPQRGAAYAWNALWAGAGAAILLIPYAAIVPHIFAAMGHQPPLSTLETAYAQTLLAGAFFTLATRAIAHYFYGMHRPGVVLTAAIVGNLVNFAANYALVLGHLGAPALGVRGSALATIIGTGVELSIPLTVFLSPAYNRLYGTRAAWRPSLAHLRDIARIGWPGAVMFGSEMVCWWYFTVVLVGSFDTGGLAIHTPSTWIALRYMHLAFMPAVGISFAVTAVVGRCMGMRRPDLAERRAWMGLALTTSYMGLCALAFVAFRRPLIGFFLDAGMPAGEREAILTLGSQIMVLAAVFQLFDAMGITMIGALRGAGDTVWPGVLTVVLSWGCLVGGGHLIKAAAPQLGSLGPWIGAAVYIILLGVFLVVRFIGGRWKRLDVLKDAAPAQDAPAEPAPIGDALPQAEP